MNLHATKALVSWFVHLLQKQQSRLAEKISADRDACLSDTKVRRKFCERMIPKANLFRKILSEYQNVLKIMFQRNNVTTQKYFPRTRILRKYILRIYIPRENWNVLRYSNCESILREWEYSDNVLLSHIASANL